MSHSLWVRELKLVRQATTNYPSQSHSLWVRELKRNGLLIRIMSMLSHSLWVRELKHTIRSNYELWEKVALLVGA